MPSSYRTADYINKRYRSLQRVCVTQASFPRTSQELLPYLATWPFQGFRSFDIFDIVEFVLERQKTISYPTIRSLDLHIRADIIHLRSPCNISRRAAAAARFHNVTLKTSLPSTPKSIKIDIDEIFQGLMEQKPTQKLQQMRTDPTTAQRVRDSLVDQLPALRDQNDAERYMFQNSVG